MKSGERVRSGMAQRMRAGKEGEDKTRCASCI